MASTPTKPQEVKKNEKLDISSSDDDHGPLDDESSDPDIDSSDSICTSTSTMAIKAHNLNNTRTQPQICFSSHSTDYSDLSLHYVVDYNIEMSIQTENW